MVSIAAAFREGCRVIEGPWQSRDFVWDEEESEALRQARKDAELTPSADSVPPQLCRDLRCIIRDGEQANLRLVNDREWVRQIESKALAKLRQPARSEATSTKR